MMIRKAKLQDSSAICKISNEDLGYQCDQDFVAKRLCRLDETREAVFVAEVKGTVAGYIHVEIYELLYLEPMVNILGLAVLSDYRRCGIGTALLCQAEDWAKAHDIYSMRLNSGMSRKGAHRFYRTMGYDNEKEQIRFIKKLK